eukprot:CAMPEP_0170169274 /NCGR_PEP_ID=MMETSP0040_2-20121228/2184_1 /TAXON_ID=641309 /ORGANISM="Lotharella oceanica, Strain CCMP622" /LENGTH=58 /DNA_ID=CAMNT_0010407907 /DNA_START=306 /DNA_END=482 /DNA_ORIENTATION=-
MVSKPRSGGESSVNVSETATKMAISFVVAVSGDAAFSRNCDSDCYFGGAFDYDVDGPA